MTENQYIFIGCKVLSPQLKLNISVLARVSDSCQFNLRQTETKGFDCENIGFVGLMQKFQLL